MDFSRAESLPPPPSIFAALKSGFNAVAAHVGVIALPIVLDLILWLGPRLRMNELIQPVLKILATASLSRLSPQQAEMVNAFYEHIFTRWNLLTVVRTFPVGISSLLAWMNVEELVSWDPHNLTGMPLSLSTPIGEIASLQVTSALSLPLWLIVLTLTGWVCGGIYYYVTWQSLLGESNAPAGRLTEAIWQTIILSLVWAIILAFLGLPTLALLAVINLFGEFATTLALLTIGTLAVWLLLPFFFSPHGIFVQGHTALRSILSGFQFIRFTAPTSSIFALAIVAISQGLNMLWSVPKQDSWMLTVGIAGHAFITTALLAGSFVYYRDMSAWLQSAFERMQQRIGTL